jgi:diguanylate cyclase (GGDEF)-like protein
MGVFSDISGRKRTEEAIRKKAFHDGLTGLPNRGVFLQQLKQALARSKRRHSAFAVLFIDLDHVKFINDTLGHACGDQVLREAAVRLLGAVRDADTVSRFGGDEFVILLSDLATESDARRIGQKVLDELRKPMTIGEKSLSLTASIGLCAYPGGGEDVDVIVNNADAAMYRAKIEGRDRLCQLP